ncbi:MAG: hypothetical protein Kow0020_10440 [Wenzhouxiangellaceae bacterium]
MRAGTMIRRAGWGVLIAVLLTAALWGLARIWPLSEAQRSAIAVMEQPSRFPGRNGYAVLWSLRYQVPEAQLEAVLAEDAQIMRRLAHSTPYLWDQSHEPALARARYPEYRYSQSELDLFCPPLTSCLERVRSRPQAYRELIDRHAARLARIESLNDYGHLDQPWPHTLATHAFMPAMNDLRAPRTQHALLFVEGRRDEALNASCRSLDTWRRLGSHSDSLLLKLMAMAIAAEYHGRQVAEMLAELPPGEPLPPGCEQALAPPTPAELSLCDALRGEFEFFAEPGLKPLGSGLQGWLFRAGYDPRRTRAFAAETMDWHCSEDALDAIAQDRPDAAPVRESSLTDRFTCLANWHGCRAHPAGGSAYRDYLVRMLDHGLKLRALATLAWLRQNHPASRRAWNCWRCGPRR